MQCALRHLRLFPIAAASLEYRTTATCDGSRAKPAVPVASAFEVTGANSALLP